MARKRRRIKSARYKKAYDDRNSSGSKSDGVLDWTQLKGKRPPFWKPKVGPNKFNIIPFEVKHKKNPNVRNGTLEVGDIDFSLDIWVHKNVGPDKVNVLCLKKNFGKHCPVCDQISEYYEKDKKKDAQALKAKLRSFFNIQPVVRGETQPLHIFEVSHYRFTKELIEEANACEEGEDILDFSDIEAGSLISCRASDESEFKHDLIYKSFKFNDREEELEEDIIDEAVSFDSLMKILSPEEIEKVMYGMDEDEKEDDDRKSKKDKPRDDDNEEEEEEKPKKSKPKRDKDDDDDNEEECPHGHDFGECEDHKECLRCKKWDACDLVATAKRKKKK